MALPSPGVLKTEISQMDAQKKELLAGREGLATAIKEAQSRSHELDTTLKEAYAQLDNSKLPDEYKPQLLERINIVKSAKIVIEKQINTLRDRLLMLEGSVGSIDSGINIRRSVLTKLAGTAAKQQTNQSNREVGRIKG
jgi:hypothetical protein